MKLQLLVCGALICSGINAQITITSGDMPVAGDSVRLSYAAGTGNVDHTLTGTNYLWDFSSLAPIAQERIDFNAPSAFPFAFMSDIALTNYSPDSLPGIGTIPSQFTDYYKRSNSSYRQIGISFEFSQLISFPIPVIFSAGDTVYRFPLNYGNIDSCDAAYGFSIPGLGYLGQDRHRVNTVDGWGTLITPRDTYNVVRVRSVVNAIDTISLDTTNQSGFTIVRPTEVQYKWLANGMMLPVLEVDCQIIANAEVVTNVAYQDSLIDGLFQVSVQETTNPSNLFVYPNPASGQLNVSIPESNTGDTEIGLFNSQGQIISKEWKRSGSIYSCDTEGVASGFYFVKVVSGTSTSVHSVIIR